MTDERIKQEQWYVKELIYKINNKIHLFFGGAYQ